MPKFFVKQEQIKENKIIIQGQDVNHIKKVLRAKIGDELQICNSQNEDNFLCDIEEINNEEILCQIKQKIEEKTESNIEGVLFPMAILCAAYLSIGRSLVLSPIAYVFSFGIFK